MTLLILLAVLSAAMIFWEDLHHRAVYWFWYPILLLALVCFRYLKGEKLLSIGFDGAVNVLLIGLELSMLVLYLVLKHRKFIKLTDGYFCLGDILFLITISFYFHLASMAIFMIIGLLLVIVGWIGFFKIYKSQDQHIPLAGLLALLFIIVFIGDVIEPSLSMQREAYFYNLIS